MVHNRPDIIDKRQNIKKDPCAKFSRTAPNCLTKKYVWRHRLSFPHLF
jgi:hypothetical protein